MRATERDYLMFYNDLQKKGLSVETSLAEFVGLCSAACNRPVVASMVIPGTLRMSGTIDEIRDLEDILRVAKNAGARKVLLPLSCIRDLQNVPSELLGSVSPDFYQDAMPFLRRARRWMSRRILNGRDASWKMSRLLRWLQGSARRWPMRWL